MFLDQWLVYFVGLQIYHFELIIVELVFSYSYVGLVARVFHILIIILNI